MGGIGKNEHRVTDRGRLHSEKSVGSMPKNGSHHTDENIVTNSAQLVGVGVARDGIRYFQTWKLITGSSPVSDLCASIGEDSETIGELVPETRGERHGLFSEDRRSGSDAPASFGVNCVGHVQV
jgi:hypothetical protein